MKNLLLILLAVCFSGAAFAQSAQFKGYAATDRMIADRLLDNRRFTLGKYLGIFPTQFEASLLDLLGSHQGFAVERKFQNGDPNAVNMLIWQVVLSSLAAEVRDNCLRTTDIGLNKRFRASLAAVCQWPDAGAKSEATMRDFWMSVMGYDAPVEEYLAWRDFFLRSSYASKPGHETVPAMVQAILMNPHFLLKK